MSNFDYIEANNSFQQENNEEIEELDLSFELPQLVRRNAMMNEDDSIQGYFILHGQSEKIYEEIHCPICLNDEEQLYPLKCGHTFCENDLNLMISNSQQNQNLVECPICRQYQVIESFEQLFQLRQQITVQNQNDA